MKKMLKKNKGQGVIEYAGALVIAAVLVATVLAIGPEGVQNLFNNILTKVNDFFTAEIGSGLG